MQTLELVLKLHLPASYSISWSQQITFYVHIVGTFSSGCGSAMVL